MKNRRLQKKVGNPDKGVLKNLFLALDILNLVDEKSDSRPL
jgi:hypothetical protein